jgi:hypothetical protein
VTSAVHQMTVNLCHSMTFHRAIILSRLCEIPARKQMDSAHEFVSVPSRTANVKSHRRFSKSLMLTKLLFCAYNAIVRSHENLSQMDYCRSSAL